VELAEWPSIRDVCERLGVTRPYVARLIASGRLRVVRTHLGILVSPESVDEYAALRTVARARRSVAC
jgi:excisionase family DNA binding protein